MKAGKTTGVIDAVRAKIETGDWPPGHKLPAIPELMAEHKVKSRSTIDRAIRALVAEGLLRVQHGSGTYVRNNAPVIRDLIENPRLEQLWAITGRTDGGLIEAMLNIDPGRVKVTVGPYRSIRAEKWQADLLDVPQGAGLLQRTYYYAIDGTPHQVARSYITADLANRLGLTNPTVEHKAKGMMARLHDAGVPAEEALIDLESRMPTGTEASELQMPTGAPVVVVTRVLSASGRPVEASTSIVRASDVRYRLKVDLREVKA